MRSLFMVLAFSVSTALAQSQATLRDAPVDSESDPPRIANTEEFDVRPVRSYPEQPPLIPHRIDGYQVDLNANKCLSCHNRHRVDESGAPMVSVTHFMDRDMQMLAEVSPRRYFCQQCHIPQTDARLKVDNTFQDVSSLIQNSEKDDR